MANLKGDFELLLDELQKALAKKQRQLRVTEMKSQPGRGYSFYGPKNFAWATIKTRLNCLDVAYKKEFVDKAGVGTIDSDDYVKRGSEYGEPGVHWVIKPGDSNKRRKVVSNLTLVCLAR